MTTPSPETGLARFRRRIAQKTEDHASPPVLIVALGDSVTQGITGLDEIAHEAVYHARFKRALQQQHPLATFSVINAGVNGHTAADGLARLDRDVVRYRPDLVLVAFGLNDAALHGLAGLDTFGDTLTRVVQGIRENTDADVALLTPNMMLTRTNDAVPACYREYEAMMMQSQNRGVLAAFADRIRDVARATDAVVVDVYQAWLDLASRGEDTTALLANGLNHPTAEAHAIAAEALMEAIASAEASR